MAHDSHDHVDPPHQAVFLGWLAIGMMVLMAAFALLVIGSGAMYGFQ
jgi:hypothetical protein